MGNIFLTADLHLGHRNVALHCLRYPWLSPNPLFDPNQPEHFKTNCKWNVDLARHDAEIIQNHNNMVKQGDLVYILGDFAWKDHNKYLSKLNGQHVLIIGNHDKMNEESKRNFTEVHEFGCVKNFGKYRITMCHYALRSWSGSYGHYDSLHAFGHSHLRMPEFDNMLAGDVGIDGCGFGPWPLECFLEKMIRKMEWIKKNGKYPVDGESRAEGQYDKSPEQRVIEIRRKNKALMRSLGYPIDERMWPNTEGI